MPRPYPIELRERVVRAYKTSEGSYSKIADQFSLGEATVKRWVWLDHRCGGLAPRPRGGGTPSRIDLRAIKRLLAALVDPTTTELTAEFNRGRHWRTRIHVSSMKRALHRHGYVVKKNDAGRWSVSAPK